MFGLIGKMVATPGNREALAAAILGGTGDMPGCLSYVVAKDPRDENALWITEVWDSAESHKASLTLPQVREVITKARPLIASFGDSVQSEPIGGVGLMSAQGGGTIERMNPQGLSTPTGYSHVVATRGGKTIYIAGQIALDAKGQLVGKGDLAAQTQQVFENLAIALKAAGATFDHVVKTNYYMRDASQVAVVRGIRSKYFTRELPASTLIEVPRLAQPDFLIEIEVIAVV
ncbi:MAG TPA: Rid family hydrolase [Vicinamibacterales bacterium]|nr:Rid family hydrolase [Vicinamibacterales bacterium]